MLDIFSFTTFFKFLVSQIILFGITDDIPLRAVSSISLGISSDSEDILDVSSKTHYIYAQNKLTLPDFLFLRKISVPIYVLLRTKKVGHQISVSFEKFDVVQALLSFF
jgi:hypothetical protein